MVKFPYGVSSWSDLRQEGFVFIDKTNYIEPLEQNEKYVSFLRPRRIGKSLFVSILEHYYDINKKHLFKELFANTYIGQHLTPKASSFRVLKFDFSALDTQTTESTYQSFLSRIKDRLEAFMLHYGLFNADKRKDILERPTPAQTLNAFMEAYSLVGDIKIYLIIDEYDHFTNEILLRDLAEFKASVSKDGYVRKFYEVIKEATQQGIVNRFFITGVSPVTLDSLTSGFNIVKHLTHSEEFHNMVGFTESEIRYLLGLVLEDKSREADILRDMRAWYNGYHFNMNATETLYNANMSLFFLDSFQKRQSYPTQMLDLNIMPDYGKLRKIFEVANFIGNKRVLEELLEKKEVVCEQIYQFNFEQPFDSIAFINFLFYLGNLTIKGRHEIGLPIFVIPNYVISELYWRYYAFVLQQEVAFEYEEGAVKQAIMASAIGDIQPFMGLVEKLLKALSNRDFQRFNEKHIKTIFTAYAHQGKFYYVLSERETTNQQYLDMEWLRHPANPSQHVQYVFELKYLAKANKAQLQAKMIEAKNQLQSYLDSDSILQQRDKLKAIAVVVLKDRVHWEELSIS